MIPRSPEVCPGCRGRENTVTDSRIGLFFRRRRYHCLVCTTKRWTTYEFNQSLISPERIRTWLKDRASSTSNSAPR